MNLSQEVAKLEIANERLRKANGEMAEEIQRQQLQRHAKLALYINLDGSTHVKPPMLEPHDSSRDGCRPAMYYRQAKYGPVPVTWLGNDTFAASPNWEYQEYRLLGETQPYYIYEQVR